MTQICVFIITHEVFKNVSHKCILIKINLQDPSKLNRDILHLVA